MSKLLKRCLLGIAIAGQCSLAYSQEANFSSDEEAFLIRRIAEFWKDGDFSIVKTQIKEFVQKYPSSSMHDYLHGILGDLLLQENNFSDALKAYNSVSDETISDKIILNKLQCYYELDDYDSIHKEGERYLSYTTPEFEERKNEYHFIMAESYFRKALQENNQDEVKDLAQKAQPFYEELLETEYGEISSFALAEVYRMLGQNDKGADLYLVLAEKHPEKKENLLFNAGLLQASLDKEAAIQIFDRIIDMHGSKAYEASYNRLLLYYQTKQFDNVISNHRLVYPHVPEDQLDTFNFVVGKSYYALEDYESAVHPLGQFLQDQSQPTEQYKDALLVQMTCAKQLGNEPLFNKALSKFTEAFPDDDELGKAHFMHAMILKKEGNLAEVEQELQSIIEKYNNFDDQESLLYEYAVVTHENEKFGISYQMFKNFLSQYSESERSQSAWRYYLSCCLHLSKDAKEDSSSTYSKDLFLEDLQKVLTSDNGFSSDEIREYRLLYAKLAYELNYFNESLETLNSYITDYAEHESLGEAHMLTALSLNKLNSDLEGFCDHLETAIKIKPDTYDTSLIHLQLFNAYISRAEQNNQDKALSQKAADYLYVALKDANNSVKLENQLWLGGRYFKEVSDYLSQDWNHSVHDDEYISQLSKRAFEVYERAFSSEDKMTKTISEDSLYLEPETLKYAQLAGYLGQKEEKLTILQELIQTQNKNPSYAWNFRRQALFELAKTYEELNDPSSALETYEFIVNNLSDVSTPIISASKLNAAVLKFNLLDKDEKVDSNPNVVKILNNLKELQIRKHAISEPAHLEAAFHYAKIRSDLSEKNMRDSRYLFFLIRMKEDYALKENGVDSEYHESIKSNPEYAAIYQSYMDFVDAEIFRVQAKQLQKENKRHEAQEKKQQAYDLLTGIENRHIPTKFLQTQVNLCFKKLK